MSSENILLKSGNKCVNAVNQQNKNRRVENKLRLQSRREKSGHRGNREKLQIISDQKSGSQTNTKAKY
jgi:hypothetical protein